MSEGRGEGGPTARRGSRNPEIAARMEIEDQLTGEADQGPAEVIELMPGDVIACKISYQADFRGQEAWITYGVQSMVQADEDEQAAAERVLQVVTTRAADAVAGAAEAMEEVQQALNNRRITGRTR